MQYTAERAYALVEDFDYAEDIRRELLAMYESGTISADVAREAWQKWQAHPH